jgi:hypothetical protein
MRRASDLTASGSTPSSKSHARNDNLESFIGSELFPCEVNDTPVGESIPMVNAIFLAVNEHVGYDEIPSKLIIQY